MRTNPIARRVARAPSAARWCSAAAPSRSSGPACGRRAAKGPPGVGKTHLAVALGLKACEHGVRVLFTTAADLIATLGKALAEGRLDERLKILAQPQLLIIDEIGYIPIDRQGANLFFQLVSRRYERGAIILTSNQSLGAWGEVFGDTVIASAILDRLLHHSITVNIRGDSYRLKEKMKAGLLKSKIAATAAAE
jgi:DNA replication protein DnaC